MQARFTLTMVHIQFNNGPFSIQQWSILVLTMDHFQFNNGPLFSAVQAGLSRRMGVIVAKEEWYLEIDKGRCPR